MVAPTPAGAPPRPTLRNTVIHVLTVAAAVSGTFATLAASAGPQLNIPAGWLAAATAAVTVVTTVVTTLLKVLNG